MLEADITLYAKMLYPQVGYPSTEVAIWFDSEFIG